MNAVKFPTAKIKSAVAAIIPKEKGFTLKIADSEIGKKKIVRVITPAWKTLRGWERISKVLKAVEGHLSEKEEDRILRFSVLTQEEYDNVVLYDQVKRVTKKAAVKRKAVVRKPRNAAAK